MRRTRCVALIATAFLACTSCSGRLDGGKEVAEARGADSSSLGAGSSEYGISALPTAPASPGKVRCSPGNAAENFKLPQLDVTNFPNNSTFMRVLHREISAAGYESEPLDNLLFTYWNEGGRRFFYGTTADSRPIIKVSVRSVPKGTAFGLEATAALVCVHAEQGASLK